jgi:hypothetical protein
MFAREVDFSVGSKRNSILRSSSTPETSSQFAVVENIRTPPIVKLISQGVCPEEPLPPSLHLFHIPRGAEDIHEARKFLEEYRCSGAVKKVPPESSKHLIPWFIVTKPEGSSVKRRLIADCRQLNKFFNPVPFKLDHLPTIFPYLSKGSWAAKIDLKDAYFHLAIHESLRPYLHLKVGEDVWEFQAACFGLNILPQKFMLLMKVLEKQWRSKGILCFVYLDDILLLGNTKHQVQKDLQIMVDTLLEAGFKINQKKSVLEPTQTVVHLGFVLNLKDGRLEVCPQKLKLVRKELGKLVVCSKITCRKMAAILGSVRSFLVALPFLRAFTDTMVELVNLQQTFGWDHQVQIPPSLKSQLGDIKVLLQAWQGRDFRKSPNRDLHSDSSSFAWGGVDTQQGTFVQEFWRKDGHLHINVKELQAAVNTVQSLAKRGDVVTLSVDNTVALSYLQKGGGKLCHLNEIVRPFLWWCLKNQVQLQPQWVPSADMQADGLSRWEWDKGDYTLHGPLCTYLFQCFRTWCRPTVDMFASPGNCQLPKFVTRWPHFQAVAVDALQCPLKDFTEIYANPPWSVIPLWLHRLKANPHLICLFVCPFWVSTTWWPQLIKLHVPNTPCFQIAPFQGMFRNCHGESMKAPRWPLACLLLSGKFWRTNKSRLTWQQIIWENNQASSAMMQPFDCFGLC